MPPEINNENANLELRSHIDMAKEDLTNISNNIYYKMKKELNKYPQFASEESET